MKENLYLTLYHLFRGLVTYMPRLILDPLLKTIAHLGYLLDKKHRHIAYVNLELAFGDEMMAKEKEGIVKKSYENLVFNLACFIKHQKTPPEKLMAYFEIEGMNYLEEVMKQRKPIIFITAHYGNWELLPRAIAALSGPLTVVGRPLDSAKMNTLLRQSREMFGIEQVDKKGAMKGLLSALKKGRNIGLLVDQNTSEKDGILIDFFGKEARHTPAAAVLARGMGLAIVPVFITSTDHHHFTMRFYPPIKTEKSDNKQQDIQDSVQQQAKVTEAAIRAKPDEWFWLHQRWKNRYEHLYTRS